MLKTTNGRTHAPPTHPLPLHPFLDVETHSKLAPCETHKLWLEDPWTRPPCEWKEMCSRTHLPHTGPDDPDLRRTNIALQTENSQLSRVRTYAAEVLGAGGEGSVTGIARSGTSRLVKTFLELRFTRKKGGAGRTHLLLVLVV